MTITLSGLMDADVATVRYVAERWLRLGETIDDAVEDLGHDTRDLPNHWRSGPGSEAAQAKNVELRTRVANAQHHCAVISAALSRFADSLDGGRERLHQLIAEAAGRGVTIDTAHGSITAAIEQGAVADDYARQIAQIVAQANSADRRASETLGAMTLPDHELTSAEPPQYDEVALLAAVNDDFATQALWWRGMHPLLQERAIAEHPDIVGALGGVPPKDRDAANRILFRRYREAAASRAVDPDGPASQAVTNAERRRAAIAELEERLAGPQPYLIGYEPGREQEAVLSD